MSAVLSELPAFHELRPMQEADLPLVFTIEQLAYTHPWNLRILQDCLRVGYRAWVLLREADIIGYGFLSVAAGEAHVLNICIDPQFQGQGYGHYLLNHLLSLARQQGADTVFLEVRTSNTDAIRLYNRLGFNQIGLRKNYYPHAQGREDAIIFALTLLKD